MKITNLFNAYLNNSIILSPLIAQICNLNTTVSVLYIRIWNFLNTQFNFFDYILTYRKKVYHKIFIKSKKWCSFHQNWKQDGFYIKFFFFRALTLWEDCSCTKWYLTATTIQITLQFWHGFLHYRTYQFYFHSDSQIHTDSAWALSLVVPMVCSDWGWSSDPNGIPSCD